MQTQDTILEEFEITDVNTSPKKQLKAVILLSAIQNLGAIIFILIPFISLLKSTTEIITNPIFILQLIVFRAIPLFALFQLMLKKKLGWSLTLIFSLIDILQRIPIHGVAIEYEDIFSPVMGLFLASLTICIISVILTCLLLKESIRFLYEVSKKRLYTSIITGLLIFGITRFLIAPYLIGIAMKTTH